MASASPGRQNVRPSPTERMRSLNKWRGSDWYEKGLESSTNYCQKKSAQLVVRSEKNAASKWKELRHSLSQQDLGMPQSEVTSSLRELLNLCKDALGDVPETACQGAALQLLHIFVEHDGGYLTNEDLVRIKCSVSVVSKDVAGKIFDHVSFMKDAFGQPFIESISAISEKHDISKNVFLQEARNLKFPFRKMPDWAERDFVFIPRTPLENSKSQLGFEKIVNATNKSSGKRNKKNSIDANWLEKTVRSFMKNMTDRLAPLEVTDMILARLESNYPDEVVSTELFELLGFDFLELISNVMSNRAEIIKAVTRHSYLEARAAAGPYAQNGKASTTASQPLGSNVSVNFTSDIAVGKKLAKEERKLQKLRLLDDGTDDLTIDEMRRIRQLELEAKHGARSGFPSSGVYISTTSSTMTDTASMPNVYDQMRSIRTKSAFVGGANLALPEHAETFMGENYNEIRIPAKDQQAPRVCPLITMIELDEPVQAAFPGVKELNLIQSAVFPVAFQSNENMLICAPTGAGKTNVAMLTIMREVMQHLDETTGRVSNDFKVVYVAPMKALASEMVSNFGKRLSLFGMVVKELTGDMQLTKVEMMKTHMVVTTPEKWDVVTRKGSGDVQMVNMVKLLILDEVHLLHGDRGPVLEALVARTLRQVESTQSMIRIIGLSATLPNYEDVANFLGVNTGSGLFFFDHRFRPVPLSQTFVGVKGNNRFAIETQMIQCTFDKAFDVVRQDKQVMVFVHSRNNTMKSAEALRDCANEHGKLEVFMRNDHPQYHLFLKQLGASKNKKLQELFGVGMGIHHAGMLRQDRHFVERAFSAGVISVLFCTSTLAWGVNLPANCVIIKGTDVYDSTKGSFVDLGILDVVQIFGRAGRPQFQHKGEAVILTHHSKVNQYVSLMTNQWPIESKFHQNLPDNLIAEIVLGTVTNIDEAVEWLSYTYLHVRMRKNPQVYGITFKQLGNDPQLFNHRRELVIDAAKKLDTAKMIRYHEESGSLDATDLGRTASLFYIKFETVERINEFFDKKISTLQDSDVLGVISQAQEFDQLQSREDEFDELGKMEKDFCFLPVKHGDKGSKVNTLLQNYISQGEVRTFSLVSDSNYVAQNATRIGRALFEMALRKGHALAAVRLLLAAKMLERRSWYFLSPLRQFPNFLSFKTFITLEQKDTTLATLRDMTPEEVGQLIHNQGQGRIVHDLAKKVPFVEVECTVHPITRTVFKVALDLTPSFEWDDRFHHNSEAFYIWVQDPDSDHITHWEYFILTKKQVISGETQNLVFTIPVVEPTPAQYIIHIDSDRWLGSEDEIPMNFGHLILPGRHLPHTELLDLQPLPKAALKNELYESLYSFSHFNPIQTQLFHTLYHTDNNVLLGAPTGSGKTITAEIAMFRVFGQMKKLKVVYIAPLKSLVKERIKDWNERLVGQLGLKMAELTGDVTPDFRTIAEADVIVTTPEKWDGVSRSWQTRRYVQSVALIVIDEIHLLGEDRGPVLEVIVSRANFIGNFTGKKVRVIGLSTALANARDLGDWLQIGDIGLFNFKPSVRPVQLEVHVSGHPGKHYCPRMAIMNKPAFKAIRQHSPEQPVLIFVSSRRQTRLTALDLITYLGAHGNAKMWLNMEDSEMEQVLSQVQDPHLKHALSFGIGMHHAGLQERDRQIVEELFLHCRIQVLIATATLAWGVNLPAHLVIVKGTEYFDAKVNRYADYPITDVLQMIGRAGRPQFDTHGVAVVMVQDIKKKFYQKFLYEPFPVESSLLKVLPDHLNAEIVAGTLSSTQDCMEYMTWTYFFRRLLQNPSYYDLEDVTSEAVNEYLSRLIAKTVDTLIHAHCVELEEDERTLIPTPLAKIASYYYLSHETAKFLHESLNRDCDYLKLLEHLCDCKEFSELPVRHNEDKENAELAEFCRWGNHRKNYDSPHTKAFLLFQAHIERSPMPSSDYLLDLKSMLDQVPRILQAQIDILSAKGHLSAVLSCITILQTATQGRYHDVDDSLLCLPLVDKTQLYMFHEAGMRSLAEAIVAIRQRENYAKLQQALQLEFNDDQSKQILFALKDLPLIRSRLFIDGDNCDGVQINMKEIRGSIPDSEWIKINKGSEYVISFETTRVNSMPGQRSVPKAATQSRRIKQKDEGWFVVLGNKDKGELMVLKRSSGFYRTMTHQLAFTSPETPGRTILTVFLVSDTYLGIDQEYNIHLDVV